MNEISTLSEKVEDVKDKELIRKQKKELEELKIKLMAKE